MIRFAFQEKQLECIDERKIELEIEKKGRKQLH